MPESRVSFTEVIPAKIARDLARARSVGGIFVFRILGEGGGVYTLNLKDDVGVVEGEAHSDPDCVIEMTNDVWRQMSDAPTQAMQFYFDGKLKVTGNVVLALRLQPVIS